jgi:hypothetical protein
MKNLKIYLFFLWLTNSINAFDISYNQVINNYDHILSVHYYYNESGNSGRWDKYIYKGNDIFVCGRDKNDKFGNVNIGEYCKRFLLNNDGTIKNISEIQLNGDAEKLFEYQYNNNGQLIEQITHNRGCGEVDPKLIPTDRKCFEKTSYNYKDGRLTNKVSIYHPDDGSFFKEVYFYDNKGNLKKISMFKRDINSKIMIEHTIWEYEILPDGRTSRIKIYYDRSDSIIKDGKKELIEYRKFTYDDKEKIITEKRYDYDKHGHENFDIMFIYKYGSFSKNKVIRLGLFNGIMLY